MSRLGWLPGYLARSLTRLRSPRGRTHLILCVADHYEPLHGKPSPLVAMQRVERWVHDYPRLFARFEDSDGRPPRHSFFIPQDEYVPEHADGIAKLCRGGFGEVEVHLHHDHDTADGLREKLEGFKHSLSQRHGLLPRWRDTGTHAYGFIHGNWALDNSRPDGRWCGVNNELDVLRETGCYADFTLPAFPDAAQTRKVNSIYYAVDDPRRPKSHDSGIDAGTGPRPDNSLLLVQGPLTLNWHRRKWGVLPRVENGCLQASQPPSLARLDLWLQARVQVMTRPDWYFVKLHTHGAKEANADVLLGDAMTAFHDGLRQRARQDAGFRYHYVTAREMVNLVRAAEAGWAGDVAPVRDRELVWGP